MASAQTKNVLCEPRRSDGGAADPRPCKKKKSTVRKNRYRRVSETIPRRIRGTKRSSLFDRRLFIAVLYRKTILEYTLRTTRFIRPKKKNDDDHSFSNHTYTRCVIDISLNDNVSRKYNFHFIHFFVNRQPGEPGKMTRFKSHSHIYVRFTDIFLFDNFFFKHLKL